MNQHQLLNNVTHKEIKIISEYDAKYGDNLWFTPTFPAELRSVQAHYPVFFFKDSQGQFQTVALFGFQHQENLFLEKGQWQASYIPLTVQRQPFLIGTQNFMQEGLEQQQRVIHIDIDHPKVNTEQGHSLFLPLGGNTDYLDNIAAMLETIHFGIQDNQQFIEQLLQYDLLESFSLDIQLDNGQTHQMVGFYTINEDKLAQLDGAQLACLHQAGHLSCIYMCLASQMNVSKLLTLKNQQLTQG